MLEGSGSQCLRGEEMRCNKLPCRWTVSPPTGYPVDGGPGGDRTHDTRFSRPSPYPPELQGHACNDASLGFGWGVCLLLFWYRTELFFVLCQFCRDALD